MNGPLRSCPEVRECRDVGCCALCISGMRACRTGSGWGAGRWGARPCTRPSTGRRPWRPVPGRRSARRRRRRRGCWRRTPSTRPCLSGSGRRSGRRRNSTGARSRRGSEPRRRRRRGRSGASGRQGPGPMPRGVVACFGAVQALLAAGGVWPKLMARAPFRTWAEKAQGAWWPTWKGRSRRSGHGGRPIRSSRTREGR